jgi:hypothetical protein
MNPNRLVLAAAVSTFCILHSAFGQGSLAPPGSPAPTMKSLDQIEARTPISSLPFTVSAPGSYYVTANLFAVAGQNGITIAANNVTIDLNGFTLFGSGGGSGEAIWSPAAQQNLVVRNGTVRNWPGSGVNFYDAGSSLATVENIHSISNGFTGIAVKNGSYVTDCLTVGNGIRGILVDNDTLVEHCKAAGNMSLGIGAGSGCQLRDNQSVGNVYGLYITGTSNIVSGNVVMLNTANNYIIPQGNQLDLLLCQIPETINWPAKVKLAWSMNVTSGNAITINANNVTLDLNGFTISSTIDSTTSGSGIFVNGPLQNIAIANGFIQGGVTNNGNGGYGGSGFGYGINDTNSSSVNVRVRDVSVSGCRFYGIYLPVNSTLAESCTVHTVGNYGIVADTIKNSSATDCGNNAIDGNQVSDSHGQTINGYGIIAVTALNCYGVGTLGGAGVSAGCAQNCYAYGFVGLSATTTENCYGYGIGGQGIVATTLAQNCYGYSPSGTGIIAFIASACHGDTSTGTPLSATHNINSF